MTDWNWPFKIFALSEAFVYVAPFDFKEVISLLSIFCCLISIQKRTISMFSPVKICINTP